MDINLYNACSIEAMKSIPDKYYDLVIDDSEYGIGASSPSDKPLIVKQKNGSKIRIEGNGYKKKDWDKTAATPEYFKELIRVSKHQIIWGENYFDFPLPGGRIVWDKLNYESDQSGCEIAYNSLNNRTDIIYFMWAGMMQGVYCGKNIQKALVQQGNKKLNEVRIHPTQKPVPLYKYLLKEYARPGWKIADFKGGSMSIVIAAHDMGFDLDLWEKDEDHFSDGLNRYNQHKKQHSLFKPSEIFIPKKRQTLL